jgi:hypothetical protein
VGDIVGLGQNFKNDRYLSGLIGLKPSKFKIWDIRESPTGEK